MVRAATGGEGIEEEGVGVGDEVVRRPNEVRTCQFQQLRTQGGMT